MNTLLYILPLVLVIGLVQGQTKDYCAVCKDHTMCQYKGLNTAKCNLPQGPPLTTAQQAEIVNKHNELRQKVAKGLETRGSPGPQPKASNMKNMTWNPELATVAQRWADQCTWGHDTCRNTDKYWWVGQNAYMSGSSVDGAVSSFAGAVQSWYDEVADYPNNNVKPFKGSTNGKMTGHYTQVVWAATTEVGCGWSKYKDGQWFKTMLICNYGPGGNMMNDNMYETA